MLVGTWHLHVLSSHRHLEKEVLRQSTTSHTEDPVTQGTLMWRRISQNALQTPIVSTRRQCCLLSIPNPDLHTSTPELLLASTSAFLRGAPPWMSKFSWTWKADTFVLLATILCYVKADSHPAFLCVPLASAKGLLTYFLLPKRSSCLKCNQFTQWENWGDKACPKPHS